MNALHFTSLAIRGNCCVVALIRLLLAFCILDILYMNSFLAQEKFWKTCHKAYFRSFHWKARFIFLSSLFLSCVEEHLWAYWLEWNKCNPIEISFTSMGPHIYTILNPDNKSVPLVWVDSLLSKFLYIFLFCQSFQIEEALSQIHTHPEKRLAIVSDLYRLHYECIHTPFRFVLIFFSYQWS